MEGRGLSTLPDPGLRSEGGGMSTLPPSEPTWRGAEPDPPRTLRPQREDRDGERPDIPPKRAIFGSARSENSIFTVFFRLGMLFSTPGYDHTIWSPHSPKFHQPRCTGVWVMLTWHRGGLSTLPSSEALGGCRVDPPNQYLTSWARVRPPPSRDPPIQPPIVQVHAL